MIAAANGLSRAEDPALQSGSAEGADGGHRCAADTYRSVIVAARTSRSSRPATSPTPGPHDRQREDSDPPRATLSPETGSGDSWRTRRRDDAAITTSRRARQREPPLSPASVVSAVVVFNRVALAPRETTDRVVYVARAGHRLVVTRGTEGRAQRGGVRRGAPRARDDVADRRRVAAIVQRSSSAAVNSLRHVLEAASGTWPRPTSQRPVLPSEIRTSQLPPSHAPAGEATSADTAIR